jgi:hypothetical protein
MRLLIGLDPQARILERRVAAHGLAGRDMIGQAGLETHRTQYDE